MTEAVLVAVAWPYANAEIHVGNLTGSYLPADTFARYQRLQGRQVLMVSGSDSHGTPITVRADAEGIAPVEVYQRYHASFLDLFQKLGITYDLFTSTHTDNHFNVSKKMFLALKQTGYLYLDTTNQWYSPAQKRFLPDRYVEGTCYICGDKGARSDQCDKCGNMLEPEKLLNPVSKIDGSTPELRSTEHYFIDLAKAQEDVLDFLHERQSYWRPNVLGQSLGQIEAVGLHGRPITRDLDWGIPLPLTDWGLNKRLYVWFEAVIGYLSAAIEWAQVNGDPEAWRKWWQDPAARTYYFIGKDNIPFHAIIWPAQLIGAGEAFDELMGSTTQTKLNLPFDVPANEFMNLEGKKISGSKHWAVWANDFLSRYDPDALRYYLTVNMPESKDTDWDWGEFVKRNNDELVATWGNLANRVLAFNYNKLGSVVPDPGELTELDKNLLATVEAGFQSVAAEYEAVHLRGALAEAMRLASEVNKYLDQTAPWTAIKTDRQAAARAVYTALQAIDWLKVMFAPILPFTSEKLHTFFGYTTPLFGTQSVQTQTDSLGEHVMLRYHPETATGHWEANRLTAGRPLNPPQPLFKKLEPKVADEERARLGNPS
jgi:methionyl-tRNA synthetase